MKKAERDETLIEIRDLLHVLVARTPVPVPPPLPWPAPRPSTSPTVRWDVLQPQVWS